MFVLAMSRIAFVTQVAVRVRHLVHHYLQSAMSPIPITNRRSRALRVSEQPACLVLLRC